MAQVHRAWCEGESSVAARRGAELAVHADEGAIGHECKAGRRKWLFRIRSSFLAFLAAWRE